MPFDPKFTISVSIASCLTSIERTRGFLEAAELSEDWIAKMQARALVLEAHHTTHIEGTHLSLDQSEKILTGQKTNHVDAEEKMELLNYTHAFNFVSDYVQSKRPITEGLIREIHKKLVENVRGNNAQPGEYRKVQNYVANSKTKEIIYTPPEAFKVPILIPDLVNWLQAENSIPPVLVAGIAQFQLVHIHPFLDGNGRTARLLSTLCLYQSGYDFKKLFTISEYYDRNRIEYYQALQSVRESDMDMTAWLEYFCTALETQMQEIKRKSSKALKLDIIAEEYKLTERQKKALEYLLEEALTIQKFEALCPGVSRRTLQRDLSSLIEKGFISQEGTGREAHYLLKSPDLL